MVLYLRDVKNYRVNRDWSINCVTSHNIDGSITYGMEVIMECVTWKEVTYQISGIKDKDVANQKFQELVKKYKNL